MEEFEFNFDPNIGTLPTKEMILSKVPEEMLWTHYGVPIKKGLFCSSIRDDKNPTCSLYKNRAGRLIYKDFATNFSSDIFGYVSELFNTSYLGALKIIANDFGIMSFNEPKNVAKIEYKGEKVEESTGAILRCEIQPFTPQELDWWAQYGITKTTLEHFNIYSVKNVWLNGNLTYIHNPKQMVFGYYGGKDENNVEKWRIYFPKCATRLKKFFISNWSSEMIQGYKQLPKKGEVIFIQKALKDVACMYDMGYISIAPNSENTPIDDNILQDLKSRFKRIIVWMDNDNAGIASMQRMQEKYPELEYYHLKDECKDLTDFVKLYGKEKGKELIEHEFFKRNQLPEDW